MSIERKRCSLFFYRIVVAPVKENPRPPKQLSLYTQRHRNLLQRQTIPGSLTAMATVAVDSLDCLLLHVVSIILQGCKIFHDIRVTTILSL